MIFSFAFLSSVALLSSAAAEGIVHQVTVGNDTGGTIYNPTNIINLPICYSGYTVVQSLFQNAEIGGIVSSHIPSQKSNPGGFASGLYESFPTFKHAFPAT